MATFTRSAVSTALRRWSVGMDRLTSDQPIAGRRVVAYALALPAPDGSFDAVWRLAGSVSTLRARNRAVPVVVFVFGDVPAELTTLCAVHDVAVHQLEPFRSRLAGLHPTAWPVFVGANLLARLLVCAELAELAPAQVLLCDQHTIVDGDVDALFDRCRSADLVAREERHCDRSAHGVDRRLLDQPLLARLAAQEGLPVVAPFDPAVVLLNHDLWRRFAGLQHRLVDYAWRLAVGATLRPGPAAPPTPEIDLAAMRATDDDVVRALPYPSADESLLVEIAWWLTLGHLDGLRTADFGTDDVVLDDESTDAVVRAWRPARTGLLPACGQSNVTTSLPKKSPAAMSCWAASSSSKGRTLSITGGRPAAANAASISGKAAAS